MTINIDEALSRLATGAVHPGLVGLENRVLLAISNESLRTVGRGATVIAAVFALIFGAFSNIVPSADVQAAPVLSPFGISSPLAPSTLLIGTR